MIQSVLQWFQTPEAIAITIALITAIIGGLLTEISPWYKGLKNPKWKPPDWAFGPVWTVIFTLAVISALIAWRQALTPFDRQHLLISFGVNCMLNAAWSGLFFKLRRPDWALVETCFLWASIVWMMVAVYPLSATAALLLAPYLLWVSIASVLNWKIVQLNKPFSAQ
jgi:translocator protein